MTKINSLWVELEEVGNFESGLLMRRYSSEVIPDIYAGLKAPEKHRCLVIRLAAAYTPDIKSFNNLRDILIEIVEDEQNHEKITLLILLLNHQHTDVFTSLCEDLIQSVSNIADEKMLINKLISRYEKWKALFDKAKSTGLTDEEQQGLYGELYFLRKWIACESNKYRCISAWLGPEKGVRDFQDTSWAVEVKTTRGNSKQLITINSEKQLDATGLDKLYLFHLSLDIVPETGESLNEIIASITSALKDDFAANTLFQIKLMTAGYFALHQPLYSTTCYQVRQNSFYVVKDNFPRVEEHEIRSGVSELKYKIALAGYTSYLVDESLVLQNLN